MTPLNTESKKMLLSVVMCTFNRCNRLEDVIGSVCCQNKSFNFAYELIVVDNNSKDDTASVVQSCIKKFGNHIVLVYEKKRGLSNARNKGVNVARGEIIAFIDDDVVLDKDWMLNLIKAFKLSDCDAIGGRILPKCEKIIPGWVKENMEFLQGPIVSHDYGAVTKEYDTNIMVPFVGANFAIKSKCFNEYGPFDINLGAGTGTMGEDTNYFLKLLKAGKKILYCGNVLAWHTSDSKRMNMLYITKWWFATGRFVARVQQANMLEMKIKCWMGVPRYLIKELVQKLIMLIPAFIYRKNLIKEWCVISWRIGTILEYRRLHLCQK